MFLSKQTNGTYYVSYDDYRGKRRTKSTGTKYKKDAMLFLAQFRKKIEIETLLDVPLISLKEYSSQYLRRCEPFMSWNTIKGYQMTHRLFMEHYGNLNLTDFTSRMIEDYLFTRAKDSSIYQARKDLIALSAMFNKAIKDGYLIKSPTAGIKRIKLPEIQPTFLSKDEYKRLLESMDDNEDMRDLTIFATATGLRQMEIITLTWNQIDFQNRFVILNNQNHITKSKKVRSIPLNADAFQVIQKRFENRNPEINNIFTLFGKVLQQNHLSQHFKKYVYKSKINPKIHFHSLRHSFASFLIQEGVSIFVVSKLLGHSDVKITMIYSHLETGDLISAVNQITQKRIIHEKVGNEY